MSAQIIKFPAASPADQELERAIQASHSRLLAATSAPEQYAAWQEMKRLCCLRSKEQIERMERKAGLR